MPNITARTESSYENMRELHRYRTRKMQVVAAILGALFGVWAFRDTYRALWPNIAALLPYIAMTVLFALLFTMLMYYGYSKRTHMRSAAALPDSWTYTFGDESFTVLPEGGETSEFRYDALMKVAETKNLILLYNSRMSSLPVAKRGMQAGTLEQLVSLLRSKLPPQKCKLK